MSTNFQSMTESGTIASISTPLGAGGLAIVRLSGPRVIEIARRIILPVAPKKFLQPRLMTLGQIIDPHQQIVIDQVLCCFMPGPHSYTTEDILEIQCHGGYAVAARILKLILDLGARLAQPGEFTKRAFLGGRIDLSQAEAVAELIAARTDREAELAVRQLQGGLGKSLEQIDRNLIDLLANLEVAIDFPDEDSELLGETRLQEKISQDLLTPIDRLLEAYQTHGIFREGVQIVLLGRPNVGKSSLLNALSQKIRALVTPWPGTTRDLIEVDLDILGLPVRMIDMAGLGEPPENEVEAQGQKLALQKLDEADLVLLMIDSSRCLSPADDDLLSLAPLNKAIGIFNKIDLPEAIGPPQKQELAEKMPWVEISALEGRGLVDLSRLIFETLTGRDGKVEVQKVPELVPNYRQKLVLAETRDFISRALQGLENHLAPELIAVDLHSARSTLGQITGPTTPDQVLDQIFQKFCLGK
ncbi:MAG: tRNA uridine-5-carboxymethylaminomethyl(34) synthesis GTPase MnmE [Syntrophales bacterium LBB04]|nr:tRNA uridine-5-carboxymethylaminomethyl(34) synthesis GTPase MnmE [Syntrophales bacterium LBB04]